MAYQGFVNIVTRGEDLGLLPGREQKSRDWFRAQASEFRRIDENKLFKSEILRSKVLPGFMYLFAYDPKFRDELPYYDRLPLVFPFQFDSQGFTAINFHYLDLMSRAKLMDMLYILVTDKNYDEKTRLKLTYDALKAVCKIPYYKACTKRYLYNRVRSRYILITADTWDMALFLPLERFAKKAKATVFSESKKIIARN